MEEIALDEWELKLQLKLKELQACQQEHQVTSCLLCSKVHSCQLRDAYVYAVYSSMNKGAGGGFEF